MDNNNSYDILLVEDDAVMRELLGMVLIQHGYRAYPAHNSQQAVDFLNQGGSAKLILLDLMTPVMNGKDFLQWLQQHQTLAGTVKIIILSMLDSASCRDCIDLPGIQFAGAFHKPISVPALLPAIHLALHGND